MTTKPLTLTDFREARTRRLRALELQVAQLGETYAPAHLLIEIEALQEEIRRADAVLKPRADRDLIAAMDPVQRHQDLTELVMQAQMDVREVKRAAEADAALREPRQHETDEHRKATTEALEAIRALLATVQQQAKQANWRSIIALILATVALVLNVWTQL